MKCASLPSSYMYWTFLTSVCTRLNFSPARKVLSTTAPESSAFSFVRTNAPPLPGFTCWNSTMRQAAPSSWMCMPFLNWLVETTSAMAAPSLADGDQLLSELRQPLAAAVRDQHHVLDPDAAAPRQVDARPAGEDVARLERVGRLGPRRRRLVHLQPDPVPEPVAEVLAEARRRDHVPRGGVGMAPAHARPHRL